MMEVVLVDDEQLALDYLEHHLAKIPFLRVIGKYTNPLQAREAILKAAPDVVFLDIQMPGIDGIEMAEQLLGSLPRLHVVFVTAYDEYAVQAFELHALDYLLKPVSLERLLKTLKRVQGHAAQTDQLPHSDATVQLQIRMFQQFEMRVGDREPETIRWRTKRAQELFLYLLQHKEVLVGKSTLVEMLWPDYDQDRAFSHLYTTIYHVRKTLNRYADYMSIMNNNDGYSLKLRHTVIDADVWGEFVQSRPVVNGSTLALYEDKITRYTGDYLQEYDYWWAESERQRLRLTWVRVMTELAKWYAEHGETDKAIDKYSEICDRYPLAEEAHLALMNIYNDRGEHVAVHRQYKLLESAALEQLDTEPSSYIKEWYLQWKQAQA